MAVPRELVAQEYSGTVFSRPWLGRGTKFEVCLAGSSPGTLLWGPNPNTGFQDGSGLAVEGSWATCSLR